jgi:small subunit ribosomal protein S16
LRLRRIGKKKMPVYHIVAADSRTARSGRFLEVVGRYEPLREPLAIETKEARIFHWLTNGARPTETVRSLFQRNGLWLKWNLKRRGKDEGTIAAEMEKWQVLQAERVKRDAERKARRAVARRKARKSSGPEAAATPAPVPAAEAPQS